MPDAPDSGKPRAKRWIVFAPYAAVALAFLAWSGWWLALKGQVEGRMDAEAERLRASGYEAAWETRRVRGYPFRIEMELTGARLAEPSGWGVAAPRLKAMAAAYKPDHWVFVAPDGATVSRPGAGRIQVRAPVLRASLTDAGSSPRLSFEGRNLTFTPLAGAKPFPFSAAEIVELHLRPNEADKAQVLWRMEGAQTQREGVFSQIAPLAPLSFRIAADLSHRSAFEGGGWRDAVRAWTAAGGSATVTQMTAAVGEVRLEAQGGPLTVGPDGRLRGALGISLKQGVAALAALGQNRALDPDAALNAATVTTARAEGRGAELRLTFEAGMTTLGPVRIAPAPKVY